jgi:hypothetical protein
LKDSEESQVGQLLLTLAHITAKEGDVLPDFKNSNKELEYLGCKDAHLKKQRELECLPS